MIRAFRWFSGRVEAWTRRPELRRRCAWLHHGPNPHGSTEYKLVARRAAPDGELPSDHLPNGCRVVVTTKIDPTRSAANLALDTHSPIQAERRLRLRLAIQLPLKGPDLLGCCQAHRQSPVLASVESTPEVRALPSTGVTRLPQYYGPVRLPPGPAPEAPLRPRPSSNAGLPRYPIHLSGVPCPLPRRIGRVLMSIASPSVQPSPKLRRVGIRVITFEACSGFTHVTARRIAQPPKAAFVTRLRPGQLPGRTARQLPDLSTTIWVDPSSTGEPRHRGALNFPG